MKKLDLSEKSQLALTEFLINNPMDTVADTSCLSIEEVAELLAIQANESQTIRLQHYLLKDLLKSFSPANESEASTQKNRRRKILRYLAMALGGVVVYACAGFDVVATILQLVNIPFAAILAISSLMAIAAVFMFYRYELGQISSGLATSRKTAKKSISYLQKQVDNSSRLIHRMAIKIPTIKTESEAVIYQLILESINKRRNNILEITTAINERRNTPKLRIIRTITSGLEGFISFCDGFCTAQTLAFTIACLFVGSSISMVSPYILIPCLCIGLIALGFFLISERASLIKRINKSLGIDVKKINTILSSTDSEQSSLSSELKENNESLNKRVKQIESEQRLKQKVKDLMIENSELKINATKSTKSGHSFFSQHNNDDEIDNFDEFADEDDMDVSGMSLDLFK